MKDKLFLTDTNYMLQPQGAVTKTEFLRDTQTVCDGHKMCVTDIFFSDRQRFSVTTVRSLAPICRRLTSTMFSEPILRQSHPARQRKINSKECLSHF